MKLLDAVNTLLPYLNERTVTTLEGQNPTAELIRTRIKQEVQQHLLDGTWFNCAVVTLKPDYGLPKATRTATAGDLAFLGIDESSTGRENRVLNMDGQFSWWELNEGSGIYTEYTQPSVGEITVPENILSIYHINDLVEVRGNKLFCLQTHGWLFTDNVEVTGLVDVPFEELPESFAKFVMYSVGVQMYTQDFGTDGTQDLLLGLRNTAWQYYHRETLRKSNHNVKHNRGYKRYHGYIRR